MAELDATHDAYNKLLFESDASDAELTKELESNDGYKKQFLTAKIKMTEKIFPTPQVQEAAAVAMSVRKTMKLPAIELPKFGGNVKEWLPFWSQFRKIDVDDTISKEDKFQYLLQATVSGSRAHDIVSSFPPTSENYGKVIKSLKNRFGRDELVVEFYVRELLGLVLQNAVRGEKKPSLSSLYDRVEANIRALETLGVTTDKCAAMLYPLVESSLPEEDLRAWQRSGQKNSGEAAEQPGSNDRLTRLLEFLLAEVENEERIEMALNGFGTTLEQDRSKKQKGKPESGKEVPSASVLLTTKNTEKTVSCIFCKLQHESKDCESARKMNLNERKEIVKRENACFVCLRRGHISKKCRVKVDCDWCSRHHVLIMCSNFSNSVSSESRINEKENTVCENNLTTFSEVPSVYLQTLKVKLYSASREKIVRVLIDSASQRSYIRNEIAEELGYIPVDKQEMIHSLFGGLKSERTNHLMFLVRMKNLDNTYACNFKVMNQRIICDTVPCIREDAWVTELRDKNVVLTDVGEGNCPIDILIGADVAGKLLTGKKLNLKNGLVAFETTLGWTVMGKLPSTNVRKDTTLMVTTMYVQEANLSDLWRLDVVGISDPIEKLEKSIEDEKTLKFLTDTTLFIEGRYDIRFPFKINHSTMSSNYEISRSRLLKTIEKLKSQNLLDAYGNVFEEWLLEEVIEEVTGKEIDEGGHYLPHRPVIKPQSTTKVRPVFDGSACKKGYPSLNQCLEKGPNLIELIPSSLNRFREREIGVVSDIKKAFLQISVNKLDRDYLRFLWLKDGEIKIFRHRRVVFGLSCSPFLLAAIINLLLTTALQKAKVDKDCGWSVESVEKLRDAFYVDNCVASVSTENELSTFMREATTIMASGGFDLRGWERSGDCSESEKSLVLGLLWDKKKDVILINPSILKMQKSDLVTKRSMLSASHKIFDPIGFSCPTTLLPKLLLQELWTEGIDWDTAIDKNRSDKFNLWLGDLNLLEKIEIPRNIGMGTLTIHMFSDASGSAYAAAVFARVEHGGKVEVHLLSARSRVAPKNATIPRLELTAASIGVRLAAATIDSLTREISQVVYWTDSTTVLAWIRRDTQWGSFVHNRIKEIRSLSSKDSWRYVPGEINPADLPSRGCTPSQLLESQWWLGPTWLYETENQWPVIQGGVNEEEVGKEAKKVQSIQMVNAEKSEFEFREYFTSYSKMIRFLAWVLRFLNNCRYRIAVRKADTDQIKNFEPLYRVQERKELRLMARDLKLAETKILINLQGEMFRNEKNSKKLSSFKTILNNEGLIVLKTKIFNRDDAFEFLCPILLDNDHEIVHMLVLETHENLGHAGALVIMSHLREKFWIVSLRKLIRSIIHKCVVCQTQKSKHMECESPPLPFDRVRDAAIFEVVGVDFAGPLIIQGGGKGWICIFTCAIYRAVHFELVSSLSTDAFLECFRRFIARRGRPKCIYSDNGTNFVGASNRFKTLNWERISRRTTALEIKWVFNPPSAPWWGGWWERVVGILKGILRKVLGKACMTYESLVTVLCDAEAIINSRPLTYVSEDPDDLKPLTPSMFIQEIREIGVPDLDMLCHKKLNKKLKHRQKIFEDLRKRFRSEYLGQLALKSSKKETRKVEIGDVVLIGDSNQKRIDWPLALIVDTVPGRDGETRLFVLKTKNGIVKRPVQRIYPLEISSQEPEAIKEFQNKAKQKFCNKFKRMRECEYENSMNVQDSEKIVVTRSGRVVKKPDRLELKT